ncbi:uncharacterized protein [Littorina saxatilis]|uniref:uncharacterized protein n=1 Tax=Littorina saxatilis TaxID=31220 RepID=UPI0038B563D5
MNHLNCTLSRLASRIQVAEGEIHLQGVYNVYKQENEGNVEDLKKFGKAVKILFPCTEKENSIDFDQNIGKNYSSIHMKGLGLKPTDTNRQTSHLDKEFNPSLIQAKLPRHYRVLQVTSWSLTVSGKSVDFREHLIDTTYMCEEADIVCLIVDKLSLCLGLTTVTLKKGRQQDVWTKSDMDGFQQVSIRSVNCMRIVKLLHINSSCRSCYRMYTRDSYQHNKKKASTDKENQDPTESENPISKLQMLFPDASSATLDLLLAQINNTAVQQKTNRRWPKSVVTMCLTMWTRSPQAYRDLLGSGILVLPSESLLILYKNFIPQEPGFQAEVFEWMFNEAQRQKLPNMAGGIIFDEMSIQADLHICKNGKNQELVGLVEQLKESEQVRLLQNGKVKKQLATHVLQLVFLGMSGFRFPFAHFPVKDSTAVDLYCTVWQAVQELSLWGFDVKFLCMDGASANRTFLKMHLKPDEMKKTMSVTNPCIPNKKVQMIMDYSHCVKKIRNNILKSGGQGCTRTLTLSNNFVIVWEFWREAYAWDQKNPIQLHRNLTPNHLSPNNSEKMRNHLAEEVLDHNMLHLFKAYQKSLGQAGGKLQGVLDLLEQTSEIICVFHDTRGVSQMNDDRLRRNREALCWFQTWENETLKDETLTSTEKSRRLLSSQCREDLTSCLIGFHELCDSYLQDFPSSWVVPCRINSDIVENTFCQQRGLHNGAASNPNYATYRKTMNSIILGQHSLSKKRNTAKSTTPTEAFPFSVPGPLRKKKKVSSASSTSSSSPVL